MVSITEEGESGSTDSQLGMRNSLVRSSKEILKTHKVPFSGFKKLKDKDKEKDKEVVGSGATMAMNANNNGGISSATKPQLIKNGSISIDGAKESMILAATKQLTKKDKKLSSAGLQSLNMDASDSTYLDKTSPLLQMKRKSSSVDVTFNGTTVSNSIDIQMSAFANGAANGDLVTTVDANMLNNELITDLASAVIDANSSKTTNASTTNNMQISQV